MHCTQQKLSQHMSAPVSGLQVDWRFSAPKMPNLALSRMIREDKPYELPFSQIMICRALMSQLIPVHLDLIYYIDVYKIKEYSEIYR